VGREQTVSTSSESPPANDLHKLRAFAPILVTGGSGFIGSHICAQLESASVPYTILDLHAPPVTLTPSRFVMGDVRNPRAVANALQGCASVLHLAAAHHDSGIAHGTYFDVNVGATRILLEAMRTNGIRRICFFSSAAVYGESSTSRSETSETKPTTPYGESKLEAERLLLDAAQLGEVDALIIRPTVTFGANNFANMFSLIRQIESGLYLHVGASRNKKSLSYVENIVQFVPWAWARHPGGADIFNWVESPDLSSGEIADWIARCLGRSIPAYRLPLGLALALATPIELLSRLIGRHSPISRARIRKLVVDQTRFSSSKAARAGFIPPVSLTDGLSRMVDWYLLEGKVAVPRRLIPPGNVDSHVSGDA
jgi:GlcNAc-P-P-Und epimerase